MVHNLTWCVDRHPSSLEIHTWIKPEGSHPYSQKSTNGPYDMPTQSCSHSHPTSLRPILVLFFHLLLGLPSNDFYWMFPNIFISCYAMLRVLFLSVFTNPFNKLSVIHADWK